MLAAIPEHEMAETLSVLAGTNASNAARHFGKQSYEKGDIAGAVLWSGIAQTLERLAVPAPAETVAMQPVPKRMTDRLEAAQLEATAFRDVRFEDVDADTLIRETLQETLAAISAVAASNSSPAAEFQHARQSAAPDVPGRPRKLELVPASAPQTTDTPSRRNARPIWARVVKHSSRRAA
jgi:hypothetical protein